MIDDDVLDEVFDFYTIADQHLTLLLMPIHCHEYLWYGKGTTTTAQCNGVWSSRPRTINAVIFPSPKRESVEFESHDDDQLLTVVAAVTAACLIRIAVMIATTKDVCR